MNTTCLHNHSAPIKLIKELPITQAGVSRHKCAVCAYEEGYLEGYRAAVDVILSSVSKSKEDIIKVKDNNNLSLARKIALSIKNKSKDTNE